MGVNHQHQDILGFINKCNNRSMKLEGFKWRNKYVQSSKSDNKTPKIRTGLHKYTYIIHHHTLYIYDISNHSLFMQCGVPFLIAMVKQHKHTSPKLVIRPAGYHQLYNSYNSDYFHSWIIYQLWIVYMIIVSLTVNYIIHHKTVNYHHYIPVAVSY